MTTDPSDPGSPGDAPGAASTLETLDDMIALLRGDGVESWARLFESARAAFVAGDLRAAARTIRGGSGGMGSLNDLVPGLTTDAAGRVVKKPGQADLNPNYS